jgi:hypothetical protein
MSMSETVTERAALTADEVMALLFPRPERGYLRVVITGQSSSSEVYFRSLGDRRWREVGQFAQGKEPSLTDALAANRWARVRFSPILHIGPTASALAPVTCIACAWNVPLIQPPPEHVDGTRPSTHPALSRVIQAGRRACHLDHEGRARVLARVDAHAPRPSLVIDEGDRLLALWRLSASLVEPDAAGFDWHRMRSVVVGHRLAVKLGGDCRFADDPCGALVDLPGSAREDVFPTHTVTATVLHDETTTIDALEEWARS